MNFPETTFRVRDLAKTTALDEGFSTGGIDFLWASPPCTEFSRVKGTTGLSANVQNLANDVLNGWIRTARPRAFVFENVPGMQNWGPLDANGARVKSRLGEYFERFLGELRALGYAVSTFKLDGIQFGGASKRVRLYVAGVLDAASSFTPPEAPPKVATKTIRDCLRLDLPTKPLAGNRRDKATLARLEIARDAGFSDAIFPANGFGKSAYPFDGPFPTVTTRPMTVVCDGLQNYRWTTAPEAGAALGFPDDFICVGTGSDAYRGVGGSVSVDATEAILTKLFGEVF
ncbi:MAG: DNA cytosine methyltransferase [Thermoguttaceae bacterium]|nr:DNA cytosine methyltransferase [Thermoguttaceae bacterium]